MAVLDPGCGSGTLLMRAYEFMKSQGSLSHSDLLSRLWGFDISPFAAELATINLFRQDMSTFDNFPRIVPGDFFQRRPGEGIPFPPSQGQF
jgi:type I restriction enzyme M protein